MKFQYYNHSSETPPLVFRLSYLLNILYRFRTIFHTRTKYNYNESLTYSVKFIIQIKQVFFKDFRNIRLS